MTIRCLLIAMLAALIAPFVSSPAAADGHKAKRWRAEKIERVGDRDCTPINGFYGYYGNPWCDTGSYRLEDIWFREKQRTAAIASRKLR